MVTYAQVNAILSQYLDDESTERYLVENRVAGINWALNRLQQAYGWALANRKGPEEALREMTKIGIWQADDTGTFLLDDPLLGYTVANVLAVYAEPYVPPGVTPLPLPPGVSQYRAPVNIADGKPVHRITLEEVPITRDNSSMRGNEVLAANPSRRTYAYYHANGRIVMLPRSVSAGAFFAVAHVEKFAPMVDENSTVNCPEYTQYILASWAWQFLSYKQGAGPDTPNVLASKDAGELFNFTA